VEEVGGATPRGLVIENALRKASAVRARVGGERPVLGVDTAVVLAGRALGKPHDEGEARAFLESLSGRSHRVWSGIALLPGGRAGSGGEAAGTEAGGAALTGAAATEVWFRRLGPADVDWYLRSGEWRERAGGYAIQGRGAALVERIAGDYWNVVGLPVAELVRLAPELVTA
jgi:septum formation protein